MDATEDMLDLVDVERRRKAVWLRQGFNKWSGLHMWGHTFTFQMTNQGFRDKLRLFQSLIASQQGDKDCHVSSQQLARGLFSESIKKTSWAG